MKKKLLALLLTVAVAAAMILTACGGGTAPAGSSQGSGSAAPDAGSNADMVLSLTTTFSQNEYAGQLIEYLKGKIEELSGGKMSLKVAYGGTEVGMGEELDFVGAGAYDMTLIGQSQYTDKLSLLNFPSQTLGGYEDAVNLIDTIAFKNETTAPLVQAEIEKNGIHMLGSLPGGSNAFITKTEYTSLDQMKGLKMGIGMNQTAMEKLGFNVVTMMPWDYYDQLSRGIADAGYMSATALVSMSLHEVMPYFLMDGTYTAGNLITINLDKWNSLDADTQKVLEDAVAATQEYSYTLASDLDADVVAAVESKGGKVNTLGEADAKTVQQTFFETGVADARGYAANAGTTDDMEVVLAAVADYVGLSLPN